MPESDVEDNSKLVITKHRALHSNASELRVFKSFTFSTKTNQTPTTTVSMTETQVTEILKEIQSVLSNPAIDYTALKRHFEQIPSSMIPQVKISLRWFVL